MPSEGLMRGEDNGRRQGLFSTVRRIPQREYEENSCAVRDSPSLRRRRPEPEEADESDSNVRGKTHTRVQSRQVERSES